MNSRHPFVVLHFDRCDDSLLILGVLENIANDMLAGILARDMQWSVATLVHIRLYDLTLQNIQHVHDL